MPLEVSELPHELGSLVGLRQPGSLEGGLAAAELLHEPAHALGLVGERAGAGEERDRPEAFDEPVDSQRHVALEGKGRVVEPPFEHRLVPRTDDLRVTAVGHEREPVPSKREIALMRLHRRHYDSLRELQEPLVERARNHLDALDEIDHFLEHPRRIAPVTETVQSNGDLTSPLLRIRLDAGRAQGLGVLVRMSDLDGA